MAPYTKILNALKGNYYHGKEEIGLIISSSPLFPHDPNNGSLYELASLSKTIIICVVLL